MKKTNSGVVRRWGSVCAICAALVMPAGAQNEAGEDGVKINAYDTVDITVQDTDLAQVLQMLSIQSKKNIIVSKSVAGSVTANLYDVTFYEALDSILRINGYGYFEQGNFIYVHSLEELSEIDNQNRTLDSRVFDLDYIAAIDAYEFAVPMLSERGTAAYRGDVIAGMRPDVSDNGADSYAYNAKLLVTDYPENIEAIGKMLSDMDTAPQQVLVEATILQTALDETNAFGVDFSVVGSIDFTDLTNPLSAISDLLGGSDPTGGFQPPDNTGGAIVGTPGNTSGPGTFKIGIVSNDISVFLKLLDEVTDTYVLARPKIMALNRQRAEVLVGARVGYLSTTATQTTSTQTVKFLDTGIQLIFRPFISKNGMIRMELSPSVSEASLRNVTDSNGSIVTIPDELTNELTTNVRVRDGETLVLGGLFRESVRTSRRQVPGLGDIPIIGAAFRGHDDRVERNEIIFLITPSIVEDEKLWAYGDETLAYMDDVRVGARDGLLPFSRDRLASTNNLRARDAFERGDTKKALYYINLSLQLQPQQPEMVKFREQITGQKVKDHERNLQERILRKVLGPMTDRHLVGQPAPVDPSFGEKNWPAQSSAVNSDPYSNDPFQLDVDSENWDYDSSTETETETWTENNEHAHSHDWTEGNDSDSMNEPEAAHESFGHHDEQVKPFGYESDTSDDLSYAPQQTHETEQTVGTEQAFDYQASESTELSSIGVTTDVADEKSLSEHQRLSMEFLNNLYIALGLPPLTDTKLSTTTSTHDSDPNKGEFPFTTFDEATGVAGVDDENPY